jgi:hypothetical protein
MTRRTTNERRIASPTTKKKSWREKLDRDGDLPKVVRIEGRMARRWGEGTCAIPSPREVDELMRCVPRGKLITMEELRAAVARKHGASMACPITTGIFSWIAAHAAEEASAAGDAVVTPYWRTLKTKGEVNTKYPGGIAGLTARLEAEGHAVIQKGKRFFVRDYERVLARV